ncbi:MAG: hypothetical protein QOI75_1819, partial [Pseudonocardiales bacterium]|nr:hypothetical protein [Pseudonocardiales bacterium]
MTSPRVHLREITGDNREAVSALRVRKRQKRFVRLGGEIAQRRDQAARGQSVVPGRVPRRRAGRLSGS